MKAKVWNLSNLPGRVKGPAGPSISMSPKSGVLSYSKALIDKLNLTENTKLNFVQDEDRPQDWYIEVSEDPHALPIFRRNSSTADQLVSRSTALVKTIFNSLGIEAEHFKSHSFPVATEPTGSGRANLYAIITKAIKK